MAGCFEWVSSRALPPAFDLRRRGWRLACGDDRPAGCAGLVDTAAAPCLPEAFAPALRRRALALELEGSDQRARWLAAGFADAVPAGARIDEIEQRAVRLLARERHGSRIEHGPLTLDLVERDARCGGRRLRLGPREFALLWRLAEAGGRPVPRETLLHDVWNLGFDPGTNSLAVHIFRLRKKLGHAGLASLLVTGPGDEGYRLFLAEAPARQIALDAPRQLRERTEALGRALEELGR